TGHVFVFRLAARGMPLLPPEPVTFEIATGTSRQPDCVTQANNITLVPTVPLAGASTYAVALLRGIKSTSGTEFQPSATWALVRQKVEPVELDANHIVIKNLTPFDPSNSADLARIQGLDLLWKAHNASPAVLPAFDAILPTVPSVTYSSRSDMLLAWSFNTQ